MQVCRQDATQDEANHSQGLLVITSVELYYATGHWFSISTVDVGVAGLKRFVTDVIRSKFYLAVIVTSRMDISLVV